MSSSIIRAGLSRTCTVAFSIALLFVSSPPPGIAQNQKLPVPDAGNSVIASAALPATGKLINATITKHRFRGRGSGSLSAIFPDGKKPGKCPLKHTSVSANVSGYIARVTVKQLFHNPYTKKIEAVYTFPLSGRAAVDEMEMRIGNRTIYGTIKDRQEAGMIYRAARSRGNIASLLNQERPNIFTQKVANIEPGKEVEITLRYIETLPFEEGRYTFAFPTVVGPRFIPGKPIGRRGTGRSADTNMVPDASRITPPVASKGIRAGHDLSISVDIDSGISMSDFLSPLHKVRTTRVDARHASVSLINSRTIPNRDFVLSWKVAGEKLKSGLITYRDAKQKSGFFTLMLVPPARVEKVNAAPKELIFLVDCSGSQRGKPLAKCKETLNYILDRLNPNDTFQIIAFASSTSKLFDKPETANELMLGRARRFVQKLKAIGGTFMAPAVEEACAQPADSNRLRIVTLMTDGYVGNDREVIGLVKKLRGKSRWFSFGTGNATNRFLIDQVARAGGGEAEYVLLSSRPGVVGERFYRRISSPVLTDVKVWFKGVEVKDVYPKELSDVWASRPLYIKGRYLKPGCGTVTVSGFRSGKRYLKTLRVALPESSTQTAGIDSVWARAMVERLSSELFMCRRGSPVGKELADEIRRIGIAHHILTPFTSFVAVDSSKKTRGAEPVKKVVPVEMPDGVSRKGIFSASRPIRTGRALPQAGFGGTAMVHGTGSLMRNGLPKTTLDSYVLNAGGHAEKIYGDEASRLPAYFQFTRPHRIGAVTTGHGSLLPDAWGGDDFVDGPELASRSLFGFSVAGGAGNNRTARLGTKRAKPIPAAAGALKKLGKKLYMLLVRNTSPFREVSIKVTSSQEKLQESVLMDRLMNLGLTDAVISSSQGDELVVEGSIRVELLDKLAEQWFVKRIVELR